MAVTEMNKVSIRKMADSKSDLFRLNPLLIEEEPGFNARIVYDEIEELAASILENGVEVPLQLYKKMGPDGKVHIYVKDGHRRLRAVKLLIERGHDIKNVPVLYKDETEEQRTFDLITCNSGKPLTKLEQGTVFLRLLNFGYTEAEIAQKIAASQAYVNNATTLARAPKKVQEFIVSGAYADSTVLELLRNPELKDNTEKIIEILTESAKEAKDESNGEDAKRERREATRKVKERTGTTRVSPAAKVKSLAEWIAEHEVVLEGRTEYELIKILHEIFQGEKEFTALTEYFSNQARMKKTGTDK